MINKRFGHTHKVPKCCSILRHKVVHNGSPEGQCTRLHLEQSWVQQQIHGVLLPCLSCILETTKTCQQLGASIKTACISLPITWKQKLNRKTTAKNTVYLKLDNKQCFEILIFCIILECKYTFVKIN